MGYHSSKSIVGVACAIVLAFATVHARADILIDDYTAGPFSIAVSNPGSGPVNQTQSGLDSAHVLLGYRFASVQYSSAAGTSIQLTADSPGARLTAPANADFHALVAYIDNHSVKLDLTQGGTNAFAVTLADAPAHGRLVFFAHSGQTNRGAAVLSITGPGTYVMPYDDIPADPGESLPDFTRLDAFYFAIDTDDGAVPSASSYTVTRFEAITVPEPTGIGLLCALTGYVLRRRRSVATVS